MKEKEHIIQEIEPGSIAWELELCPGDVVLSVNGEILTDVFDYRFLCHDEYIELLIRQADGEEILFEIEKDEDEDLGIIFENGLMDEYRSCRNKCMFCFVDQMPPGMRETLYFKDDDSRLSFLQGNYVTLTNLSEKDLDRIIRYRLEPINISIHTMDPDLRCQMLHNRFAGDSLKKLDLLRDAGIEMNAQIVLCPGINDGKRLDYTIEKLSAYLPYLRSVSIVPVGLTRFREGLAKLKPVSVEIARETIAIVEQWQEKLYPEYGVHFIHASDEFYIQAGLPMPTEEQYDGYLQLSNGVGMVRLMQEEFYEAWENAKGNKKKAELSIATGALMAPFLQDMVQLLQKKFPHRIVHVYPIANKFFGESITVAGLITGQDLMNQLKDRPLGDALLISQEMLREGEDVFLDDFHLGEVSEKLGVSLQPVSSEGGSLFAAMVGENVYNHRAFLPYEPEEI